MLLIIICSQWWFLISSHHCTNIRCRAASIWNEVNWSPIFSWGSHPTQLSPFVRLHEGSAVWLFSFPCFVGVRKLSLLAEERFTLPGIQAVDVAHSVGQALVTVVCFFLSHDAYPEHMKDKISGMSARLFGGSSVRHRRRGSHLTPKGAVRDGTKRQEVHAQRRGLEAETARCNDVRVPRAPPPSPDHNSSTRQTIRFTLPVERTRSKPKLLVGAGRALPEGHTEIGGPTLQPDHAKVL